MKGPGAFDKFLLWALNHVAVANISQFGGRFRREPIYVGNHRPPHFNEVDDWMDRLISTVQENWYVWTPTELAAYGLWRLNWIHPFIEGNGRTARAAATTSCAFARAHFFRADRSCQSGSERAGMITWRRS